MAFEEHIFYWNIYDKNMVNENCNVFWADMYSYAEFYVDHSSSAVEHTFARWQAYSSVVRRMYTRASGHIFNCKDSYEAYILT